MVILCCPKKSKLPSPSKIPLETLRVIITLGMGLFNHQRNKTSTLVELTQRGCSRWSPPSKVSYVQKGSRNNVFLQFDMVKIKFFGSIQNMSSIFQLLWWVCQTSDSFSSISRGHESSIGCILIWETESKRAGERRNVPCPKKQKMFFWRALFLGETLWLIGKTFSWN